MDTKTAPADKSDECCFFIGIVLFGREVITLSNLLGLRLRKPRIYRTKKAPLQVLLGFWFYFAAQRQCSFASAERLLCKSFLYCNRTCNAFIEPKKHLCRCFWVFGSTLLSKDNARSQVRNDYFVSPSCTATAHATEAPTIGLLPIPIRPIISTCAGTDDEPANCASECILPIVSVMP